MMFAAERGEEKPSSASRSRTERPAPVCTIRLRMKVSALRSVGRSRESDVLLIDVYAVVCQSTA